MASIWELKDSGSGKEGGDKSSSTLTYMVTGTTDDSEVEALVAVTSPPTYRGLVRQDYAWDAQGAGIWICTVNYGRNPIEESQEPEEGEYSVTIDTTGGTQRIYQSYGTGSYGKPGETPPEFKNAIGVNGDNVEGCEIFTPKFDYSETHHVPAEQVTGAYWQTVYGMAGKTNSATWRGFPAGELLFLGAVATGKWSSGWQITYKFLGSPNQENLTIGEITEIRKDGHEYMWIRYEDELDSDSGFTVKRPSSVYVELVYQSADFQLLGIGG